MATKEEEFKQRFAAVLLDLQEHGRNDPEAMWLLGSLACEIAEKSGKTTLHYLTDDQRKAWQKSMQGTYKWAKGRVGQEVLDLLAKELNIKMN